MKGITILLSVLMLTLSIKPCADGFTAEDEHSDEISVNHNHKNDAGDACPITCVCNCCGTIFTYQPFASLTLKIHSQIPTTLFSSYKSNYRFYYHPTIWQPPQLIS